MTEDQADRDRAVADRSTSIALSAGAGSGKTTVLARRVAGLLADGVDPARIVAITFTEKAAGELLQRIRDEVELRGGVPRLPELVVSTIHAFCSQLLVAESLEAGWAPDTEMLPELLQSPEVERAVEEWESSFRARHPVAGLVLRQRVKFPTLRAAAMRLLEFRDLEPVRSVDAFDVQGAFAELVPLVDRMLAAIDACHVPDEDKLLAANRPLTSLLAGARSRPADEAIPLVLGSPVEEKRTGGRKGDWDPGGKDAFLDRLSEYGAWRDRHCERLHGLVVGDLWERFLPVVDAAKRAAAVADFDDLLFRAAAVLTHGPVRARLSDRFDRILIDEVQDTDPIQAEVAALLTRDPVVRGPWDAAPPRPGRLFAVGDPRQSIYRFRRADVDTWAELDAMISRGGASLSLDANYRSVPALVDWVNHTFADLPGYRAQQAVRAPAELTPVVRLVTRGADSEIEDLASWLVTVPSARVVDRETGALRSARWSDVMILLPSWTQAESVQSTLVRAGVPALVEGGGAYFGRDEVRVALAALRCLDEPADEPSTVLVLRGLFGIGWEELARHRAAGGTWRFTRPDPPAGPVADAFATLRELGRQRGRVSWVALLDALLERTRASAVWAALADGESRLANLDKLRALVRRIEGPAWSPGETMRLLEGLAGQAEKDLSRLDLDSDAVRITSYFKAKGLEAPIVVLCAARRNDDGVQAAVDRRSRRVAVKVGDLVPPDWSLDVDREKAANAAERRRWMYVAATRARDQLVLVDHDGAKLLHDHLANGLPRAAVVEATTLPRPPWLAETFPGHDRTVDEWLAEAAPADPDPTAAWVAARRDQVRASQAGCTRWRSVVEVAARERVSTASSPVGALGGVVVHEVMEQLDLGLPLDQLLPRVESVVAGRAAAQGLDEALIGPCVEIVLRMLHHPVIERARAAPERWVEVPFSVRDRGRVVSGRIDLCFPIDASRRKWVVVDWKSELPPTGTAGWRNYQRQLGWYAKALLATVSPCEEVETVLVGPHPELGDVTADPVADAHPALGPWLRGLLDRGGPIPRVGADVGEPLVAVAELAWDEAQIAVCAGSSAAEVEGLRRQGWTVVEVDPASLFGAEVALEEVATALLG